MKGLSNSNVFIVSFYHSNLSNGEQMEELIPMAASTVNRRMVCLQVAAFIFNNIPLYSFYLRMQITCRISPHQKSPQSSRKRVSCSMDLSKDQYLSVFGNIGVRKDLCRLATPPKDGMDWNPSRSIDP